MADSDVQEVRHAVSQRRHRRRVAAAVAVLSGVLAVGAGLATLSGSDREDRARAAAASAGEAFDAIQWSPLRDVVLVDATVEPSGVATVTAPSASDGAISVVTASMCRAMVPVGAGHPVVELNDRPVFVLPGSSPLYRDLDFGFRGEDVGRFQDALLAADIPHRPMERGVFDEATSRAVAALYERAGYTPPVTMSDSVAGPVETARVMRAEVVLVPLLPGVATADGPAVGSTVQADQPLCRLATGAPRLIAPAGPLIAAVVEPGQQAAVTRADGRSVAAVVAGLEAVSEETTGSPTASGDGGDSGEGGGTTAERTGSTIVLSAPADGGLRVGDDLRVEITVGGSAEPVLHVSPACVRMASDGAATVDVKGRKEPVGVEVGPVVGGRTPVLSVDGGIALDGEQCRIVAADRNHG